MPDTTPDCPSTTTCESPPPANRPPIEQDDPRTRLHQLAQYLTRTHSRQRLIEYLTLRRALR